MALAMADGKSEIHFRSSSWHRRNWYECNFLGFDHNPAFMPENFQGSGIVYPK